MSCNRLFDKSHPLLGAEEIKILFKKKIFTCLDFVKRDPEYLATITGLNYRFILDIRRQFMSSLSSTPTNGLEYLNNITNNGAILSSGLKNLDLILDGGFFTGNLYELCGQPASCKTLICLTTALGVASKPNCPVLIIDTKNDINPSLVHLIESKKIKRNEEKALLEENLSFCGINDIFELLNFLHKIKNNEIVCPRVIFIDSLTSLFYPFLGNKEFKMFNLLNNLVNIINYLLFHKHIIVVVLNLVVKWISDCKNEDGKLVKSNVTQKPALGKYWSQIPGTRINVHKLLNSNECLLTVLKSTNMAVGTTSKLLIKDGYIQ